MKIEKGDLWIQICKNTWKKCGFKRTSDFFYKLTEENKVNHFEKLPLEILKLIFEYKNIFEFLDEEKLENEKLERASIKRLERYKRYKRAIENFKRLRESYIAPLVEAPQYLHRDSFRNQYNQRSFRQVLLTEMSQFADFKN